MSTVPDELAEIIETHRALFGGFMMMADGKPETPELEPEGGAEPDDQSEAPEADTDQPEDWRDNFDADKASSRIRKLQSEARNLRERAKTAEEKAAGLTEKDQRISELESLNLRYEVGYELGLPAPLVNRLAGSSREELIEDAKSLLDLVGSAKPTTGRPKEALRGGGRPDAPPEETDVDKIGARMFHN